MAKKSETVGIVLQEVEETRPNLTREDYTNALARGVCTVIFRKKDGTLRTMKATRQQTVIESVVASTPVSTKPKKEKAADPQQISVIDVEVNQWRSFMMGDVISFEETK